MHVCNQYAEVYKRHPRDGFDVYEWCLEHNIDLDSPLNGSARWLQSVDLMFYRQLCRQRRKLLYVPREVHMTYWAAERTIDYIDNSDDLFFYAISVFDPHNPYQDYPLKIGDLIDEAKIPDLFILESDFEETLPTLKRLSIEGGNALITAICSAIDYKRHRAASSTMPAFVSHYCYTVWWPQFSVRPVCPQLNYNR